MKPSRFHHLAAVSLLTLVAFAVRAVSLDVQPLWRDEVDALRFATVPWPKMLASFTRPGWNGPFYYVLLRGWVALAGASEYGLRFFSLSFGALCVPLAYVLGRRLFDRSTGLLVALLMATSPYLTWYSQEVKMYTLVPALALLAIYGLRRAIEGSKWHWWAALVAATSLACYSHILAALLIPVQILLYFAWWPQARKRWAGALASLVSLTLPYLPLLAWQAPLLLQERETGFLPYTLSEMVETLLNGWSLGMLGWGWSWGVVLMGALAVWGLFFGGKIRNRFALACWLAVPLLAMWLISLRQPLFTDRYLAWAAPAFYLLISLGLVSLMRMGGWGRWMTVALVGIIIVLNGVNLWRQAATPIKSNFRAAAAYIADYRVPNEPGVHRPSGETGGFTCYLPLVMSNCCGFNELVIFQIPYAKYTFDYYFPEDEYPWAEGLYTNHRSADGSYLIGEREVADGMQEMTAGRDVVWLVATETAMWDERGLVQAWLETNWERADEAHFMRVDVYRYVR
ncbi:MAG TPA: hypothetical protein G4N99_02630 [Thermoflexia bacterium]|nr:hypothetical protein [Thermoflexia bacterium]